VRPSDLPRLCHEACRKQASLDACPDASEEAKKILGESAAPPIRDITLGVGDKAVKMGGEICLFRHDKKFFNPNVFAVAIKSSEAGDVAAKKIEAVRTSEIDRVGQKLRVDAIAVTDEGGDAAKIRLRRQTGRGRRARRAAHSGEQKSRGH